TNSTVPATLVMDQNQSVSFTIANQGSLPIDVPWTDAVFLSQKSTFDETATPLASASATAPSPFAGGQSYSPTVTFTIPPASFSGTPGDYFLLTIPDANHGVAESNKGNHLRAVPVRLVTGGDLQVTATTAPDTIIRNTSATVSFTVAN